MSVSKYMYESWKCDGDYCPGDCDFCGKAETYYCEKCTNEDFDGRCSECPVFLEENEQ